MEAYSITDDQGNPSKAPDALVTAITCASSMSVERLKELIELHSEEVITTPTPFIFSSFVFSYYPTPLELYSEELCFYFTRYHLLTHPLYVYHSYHYYRYYHGYYRYYYGCFRWRNKQIQRQYKR